LLSACFYDSKHFYHPIKSRSLATIVFWLYRLEQRAFRRR